MPDYTFALLVALAFVVAWLNRRLQKRRAKHHMMGRPRLTHQEFGRHFFTPDKVTIAARVRDILSEYIPADLSQAWPEDRLGEDLRLAAFDPMATIDLVTHLERRFGVQISDPQAQQLFTIRDIVDCIAAKTAAKGQAT